MYDFSQPTVDAEDIETVTDYIWAELREHYFDRPQWWPTYYGAVHLYEDGMFGSILSDLDRVDFDRVEAHLSGDCRRCGAADTGSVAREYRAMYEKPGGESFAVSGGAIFCDECIEVIIHELTTYGEAQPRLGQFA